ncbi:LysR family transcriptional regulator [Aquabacterium sp. J223]|uniref:LysR family transcriptional regulator n=1 Tax=Aquabacterium sp. J223 TaxID=2898431 RepID=UPI0021AE143A|nr:LysR family transcriptional regulator [Aquabacterium sp. J223]UUX94203.1 LysR family transcriptional regulator [Aquabacterium sp. J223]
MTQDFDWRLVRSFLAALEHGSLLGAARALGASQPTLGRHIAELEAQLGVALFERTGRGLRPTDMAQTLADGARAMEAGALQLARRAAGADAAAGGTVRLSASQPVACHLLPPVLARMRTALPDIQVELVASNEVSNLLRREADIALRMVQPQQSTLLARRIGRVTLGAYAHRDYLQRRGVPKSLADLRGHDLIGGDQGQDIVKGFASAGLALTREDFVLRTDDLVAGWQALRAGVGIGFVADYVARGDPAVVPLLPMLKIPPLPMWLVSHREVRHSQRIRAVWDFLAQAVPTAL